MIDVDLFVSKVTGKVTAFVKAVRTEMHGQKILTDADWGNPPKSCRYRSSPFQLSCVDRASAIPFGKLAVPTLVC